MDGELLDAGSLWPHVGKLHRKLVGGEQSREHGENTKNQNHGTPHATPPPPRAKSCFLPSWVLGDPSQWLDQNSIVKSCKILFINTLQFSKMYKGRREKEEENLKDARLMQTRCQKLSISTAVHRPLVIGQSW
jgi:hypothetical protein